MKKIFLFLILTSIAFSQTEYVRLENPLYLFLERMDALNIISGYSKFELPITRKEAAVYLHSIIRKADKLDEIDRKILDDLKKEFEIELYGTLKNSQSIIGEGEYNLLSQKQKYLFLLNDEGKANLFINLIAEGQLINRTLENNNSFFTPVGVIGGEIRGTFLNKIGFFLRGTNGNVFGDKEAALARNDIKYNYKFNSTPDETFFDETEGYITADFDLIKFKFGRDRMNIGYGAVKSFLGSSSPMFDYLSLKIKYDFFSYSYFHGKLLGRNYFIPDSITFGSEVVEEKYIGYHRIGFDPSKHFGFGIGELVIYGDRPIDLSYVNPFAFYKSVEHSNQDRDNAMLFADAYSKSIDGLFLYASILIDDISYGKLGSGWWGNQTVLNAGFYSANLYKILPLDFRFDYFRIEPYTFTHRLIRNNYTNFGYNLSSQLQPNSELFYFECNYRFFNRLIASAGFGYTVHGANPVDENGTVTKNAGGDINLGHRVIDSDEVHFLDGELEYKRNITFSLSFEPVKQIKMYLNLFYINESLQKSTTNKSLDALFTLELKL